MGVFTSILTRKTLEPEQSTQIQQKMPTNYGIIL